MKDQTGKIMGGIMSFVFGVFLVGMATLPGEASSLGTMQIGTPPIAGIGDRYLGLDRAVRDDGKKPVTILCKMGYDSVLIFPGRIVRKIFFGGYSWGGSVARIEGGSLVVIDPPMSLPVSANLVVVFDRGVSMFRLKIVDPDKPFMARTTVLRPFPLSPLFKRQEKKDQPPK